MTLDGLIKKMKSEGTLRNIRVERALRAVPRELFVPLEFASRAYIDEPLPLATGSTISQPSTVVIMTQLLDVRVGHNVLEVGTGSGWQAALLGKLAGRGKIITIEIDPALAETARSNLSRAKIENVDVRVGDGSKGVRGETFDRIILTVGVPDVPLALFEQLREGGRLVAPVGIPLQHMLVYEKHGGRIELVSDEGEFVFVSMRRPAKSL